MTPNQQRIAIAEACGWKSCADIPGGIIGVPPKAQVCSEDLTMIPWFESDLNAMHEAEKTLDITNGGPRSGDCLRYAYSRELYKLVPECEQPFRATAAQRVEAFLRTIGKWTDT